MGAVRSYYGISDCRYPDMRTGRRSGERFPLSSVCAMRDLHIHIPLYASDYGCFLWLDSPAYQGLDLLHNKKAAQVHSDRILRHFPVGADIYRR